MWSANEETDGFPTRLVDSEENRQNKYANGVRSLMTRDTRFNYTKETMGFTSTETIRAY